MGNAMRYGAGIVPDYGGIMAITAEYIPMW